MLSQFLRKSGAFSVAYRLQRWLSLRPRSFVFITGCPRSGTWALVDWLHKQKEVITWGESRVLICAHRFMEEVRRFASTEAYHVEFISNIQKLVYDHYLRHSILWNRTLVEKEPLEPIAFPDRAYNRFIENIMGIFPDMKIIFMVRDPIPTIWSMTQRDWGHSLSQGTLKRYSIEECVENWCECAALIQQYESANQVYVCRFERLVDRPEEESLRIRKFMSIGAGLPFEPKKTKVCGFNDEEQKYISDRTKPYAQWLYSETNPG